MRKSTKTFQLVIGNILASTLRVVGAIDLADIATSTPTNSPSFSPTNSPTLFPTNSPTVPPTTSPTPTPTNSPTLAPTSPPTSPPSNIRTSPSPSQTPSELPSESPSVDPTQMPTKSTLSPPTSSPSQSPTSSQAPSSPQAQSSSISADSISSERAGDSCDRCTNPFLYQCHRTVGFDGRVEVDFRQEVLSTGVCSDSKPSIAFQVQCSKCDGSACSDDEFVYQVVDKETTLRVIKAPLFSSVTYKGSYNNGCGIQEISCRVLEERYYWGQAIAGRPFGSTEKTVDEVDPNHHWGWYQEISKYPGGDNVYSFQMVADYDEPLDVGLVEVPVKECERGSTRSGSHSEWFIGTPDMCIREDSGDHLVHVGTDYPRDESGKISFASIFHKEGCCVAGEKCIISVRSVVIFAGCVHH